MRLLLMMLGTVVAFSSASAGEVASSAEEIQPLLIGSEVPDVTLRTVSGDEVVLREAVSEKPAVIIFYRGGWCPYCNRHLASLRDAEQELVGMGYQVLAVSADSPATLTAAEKADEAKHTLLSDSSTTAAQAFGIAFKVEESLVSLYKNDYGIDLEAASGETHHILPVPAVFIVGQDGIVDFAYVNPDYKQRLQAPVLLAAATSALEP